jgi:hypothetical protein
MGMDSKTAFQEKTTERHHEVAVENIAKSMNRSKEGVNVLYAMVLRHYARTARIKQFLSPLVVKRVKELMRDEMLPADIEGRRNRHREL